MSITYKLYQKNQDGQEILNTTCIDAACYSNHFNNLRVYSKIEVFFYNTDFPNAITNEEIVKYLKNLKKFGIKIDYRQTNDDEKNELKSRFHNPNVISTHCFTFKFEDNLITKWKIALTSIRYLQEYHKIVIDFNKACDEKIVGVGTFQKFLLAHYMKMYGHGGHTFVNQSRFPKLLKNAQYNEQLLHVKGDNSRVDLLLRDDKFSISNFENNTNYYAKFVTEILNLQNLNKDLKFSEILKVYKKNYLNQEKL